MNWVCYILVVRGICILLGIVFVLLIVIDMFGGNILEVLGFCFLENEVIVFLFGDFFKLIVIGECFWFFEIKVKCEVFFLIVRGCV